MKKLTVIFFLTFYSVVNAESWRQQLWNSCESGNLTDCKEALTSGEIISEKHFEVALKNNHFPIFETLLKNHPQEIKFEDLTREALWHENTSFMENLLKNDCFKISKNLFYRDTWDQEKTVTFFKTAKAASYSLDEQELELIIDSLIPIISKKTYKEKFYSQKIIEIQKYYADIIPQGSLKDRVILKLSEKGYVHVFKALFPNEQVPNELLRNQPNKVHLLSQALENRDEDATSEIILDIKNTEMTLKLLNIEFLQKAINSPSATELILSHGFDPNTIIEKQKVPIYVFSSNKEVLGMYEKNGAKASAIPSSMYPKIIRLIIHRGFLLDFLLKDPNWKDQHGVECLIAAAERERTAPIVKKLVDAGVPIDKKNKDGISISELALTKKSPELLMTLYPEGNEPFLKSIGDRSGNSKFTGLWSNIQDEFKTMNLFIGEEGFACFLGFASVIKAYWKVIDKKHIQLYMISPHNRNKDPKVIDVYFLPEKNSLSIEEEGKREKQNMKKTQDIKKYMTFWEALKTKKKLTKNANPTETEFGISTKEIENFIHRKQVSISRKKIESIPTAIIDLKKINSFSIQLTELESLDDLKNFKSLKDLIYLSAVSNQIKKFPEFTSNLPNLKTLVLAGNKIQKINPSWKIPPKLEHLNLENNQLQSLPSNWKIPKKLKLLVSGNQLQTVPSFIANTPETTRVAFSNNRIEKIPNLQENKKLRGLSLSKNRITSIPKWLATHSHIQRINLDDNAIGETPNFDTPELTTLNLQQNRIQSIDFTKANFPKLEKLYLSGNRLTQLDLSQTNFPKLKELYITDNLISSLKIDFNKMPSLIILRAQNNKLDLIPKEFFSIRKGVAVSLDGNLISNEEIRKWHKRKIE